MQRAMQSLTAALAEWADMRAIIDDTFVLVRDFRHYGDPGGILVKIDGEEPDGINNGYCSAHEIERDLAKVIPGYIVGAPIWQEVEEDE